MLLSRVEIKNFRQFREVSYDFRPGVTAIIGANGSGKTSLLEAITWCLFGEQRDKKETLRSLWAEGKSKTQVSLQFRLGDADYGVERTEDDAILKKLTPELKILNTRLKPVTEGVEKLLNMTYEQFKNSYLTEQKDLRFLKFSSALRQRDEVAKMLGFDRLGTAAKIAKERGKSLADQARGLELSLSIMEDHEKDLKEKKSAIADLISEIESIKADLVKVQPKLQDLQKQAEQASSFKALTREIEIRRSVGKTLNEQKEDAKKRMEEAKSQVTERLGLQAAAREFDKLESDHRSLLEAQKDEGVRAEIEKRLNGLNVELAKLTEEIEEIKAPDTDLLQAEIKKVEVEREESSKTKSAIEAELKQREKTHAKTLATLEAQLKSSESDLAKKQKAHDEGKCPTCGKPWTEQDNEVFDQLRKEVDKLKSAIDAESKETIRADKLIEAEESIASFNDKIRSLSNDLQAANLAAQRRVSLLARKSELETDIADNSLRLKALTSKFDKNRFDEIKKEMETLRPKWKRFHQLENAETQGKLAEEQFQNLQNQFLAEKEAHDELIRKRDESNLTDERVKEILAKYEETKKQADDLESKKLQTQTRIEEQQKAVESIQKTIETLKIQKKQRDELMANAELHREVEIGLNKLRELLSEQTKPLLEQLAGNYLQTLTSGRYSRLILNEKYEATIFDDEQQKPVISGGEEDVVALALRLSLAQIIQERSGQPMSLLMLDEVFGSLDVDRRSSVMEQIDSLRGTFEQILVISHIDSINDSADRCVEVRYDPVSRQSTVQEVVGDFALQ